MNRAARDARMAQHNLQGKRLRTVTLVIPGESFGEVLW